LIVCGACIWEPSIAILVTLCIAPLKTLIETESNYPFPLDVGQIGLLGVLGLFILRFLVEKKRNIEIPYLVGGAILLFIGGSAFSILTSYSASVAIRELIKWIQVLLLVGIVANTTKWQWVLLGVLLSAALQALIGIWQFLGGSGAPNLWIMDFQYFRAFGTFGQPNPYGAFMAMVLPLGLGTTLGHLIKTYQNLSNAEIRASYLFWSVVYGVLSSIILLGMLASWSRGAWLGFLVASGVMIWMLPRQRWIGTLLIVLGAITLFTGTALGVLPQSVIDRLTGFGQDFVGFQDVRGVVITDENYAVVERLAHWQSAIEMAEDHFWLGVGFGNYEVVYDQYALINWPLALGHAHNYYLNLLAEVGLVGTILYLAMWGIFFYATGYIIINADDWQIRCIAIGLLGTWTHISVHHLLDKLYVNNLFLHIGVMLGILAVLYMKKSGEYSN